MQSSKGNLPCRRGHHRESVRASRRHQINQLVERSVETLGPPIFFFCATVYFLFPMLIPMIPCVPAFGPACRRLTWVLPDSSGQNKTLCLTDDPTSERANQVLAWPLIAILRVRLASFARMYRF